MKNQVDLIISIVAFVFAVIISIVLFSTKREPVSPEAAPTPDLTAKGLPEGTSMVQYANGLPGGGGGGGSARAPGGGGFGGGSMGMSRMGSMPSAMASAKGGGRPGVGGG